MSIIAPDSSIRYVIPVLRTFLRIMKLNLFTIPAKTVIKFISEILHP